MKDPVRIAITGGAGQISYSLIFRIAAGDMLGPDQPVILQLLEIPQAMDALNGVVMEVNDCAFPLVQDIVATDDAGDGSARRWGDAVVREQRGARADRSDCRRTGLTELPGGTPDDAARRRHSQEGVDDVRRRFQRGRGE